jgi:hypothetical protein
MDARPSLALGAAFLTPPAGSEGRASLARGCRVAGTFSGMSAKEAHEDEALVALADELNSRGRKAVIVRSPDRDPSDPLTVDAIIRIDGQDWAVDHCMLSSPPDLPGALTAAEKALQPRLDAVAEQYQCGLIVTYQPQSKARHDKQHIDDYYDEVVRAAERAAQTGCFVGEPDDFVTADRFSSSPPVAHLISYVDTAGSRGISDQVEAGIRDALEKKLTGQLARAKDCGLPVALLIDQIPRLGRQGTVRSASPRLIARAVQESLNAHPGIVDQIWLRPAWTAPPYMSPPIHLLIAAR